MNEINIEFKLDNCEKEKNTILLTANQTENENLLYKFFIGKNGMWKTLNDFSTQNKLSWEPIEDGRYIIMVQAKKENSRKSFDYIAKSEYYVGKTVQDKNLIQNLYIDKKNIKIGDKLTLTVDSNVIPALYKYWIKQDGKWELMKDYSAENKLNFTATNPGNQEILVECRNANSNGSSNDFGRLSFKVNNVKKVQINDFKCCTKNIIRNKDIEFKVDAAYENERMVLYKFIHIDSNGKFKCIQDYSTNPNVICSEKSGGEYKLLCLAKDMYSPKEYDDRAIIFYKVKSYEKVKIKSFTSDVSSPQICGSDIKLKALVKGGEKLKYRFIVNGVQNIDTGYINENNYLWKPTESGKYNIKLYVKDESYEEEFEDSSSFDFNIDEISIEDVKIEDIIYNKKDVYLKNEVINVEVKAFGGIDLRYSFIVKMNEDEIEKTEYSKCNLINFIPEKCGNYELEIRIKDKYSKRNYDTHFVLNMDVRDYAPANIDYVIVQNNDYHMVGDKIKCEIISQDTKNVLIKYKLKINGHELEETDFINKKLYELNPKCKGIYELDVFAKNCQSNEKFDCKKKIKLCIHDCFPVTNTKLKSDRIDFKINECAGFFASSNGGKDVVYEFYLMEKQNWKLVQKFSKKNYYNFIPFTKGKYKVLVLSKSMYKRKAYEDCDVLEFHVN